MASIIGNSDIITKLFYTGTNPAQNRYDVDNLTASFLHEASHEWLEDLTVTRIGTGEYTISVTYPDYPRVILQLQWEYQEVSHVERVLIELAYITANLERDSGVVGSFS